jgi:aspartyl-tRNA(Asn)/glutamyl-tRNA(Gln) amidotransferase subunit A
MSDITKLSANEITNLLANKKISATELTKAYIENSEKNNDLNIFITKSFDSALKTASKVDEMRAKNEKLPLLAGVPIAVKDNISTENIRTTAASKILDNYIPVYDATVVTRLKKNFMPIIGKTNLDEFAMGSSNEHSAYGPVKNPVNTKCVPGGSGGGSAAALASFCAPLALGSDTGGSIRQPASFTGTVGAKPTYGAVSRYGLLALSSSLDQIGPATKTVQDAGLLSEIIYGYDNMDSTSLKNMTSGGIIKYIELAEKNFSNNKIKGLKIGVVKEIMSGEIKEHFQKEVFDSFTKMLDKLESNGAEINEII